ncbi:DNA-binding SARP family transcriptional activator/predicted ATPase [Streptococcus rupicaprae]|uniref:DNA-binding SARP family transcriptional activator/predicted ATPase n=1 Tax=Streptococcus rupicaprae TaxID=759619 RepID=A0ABV2FKA2_9STRE
MVTLTCNLFGQATLLLDKTPIRLPYAKVNALLYYLLLKGKTSREEIAGILWEQKDNHLSRKNLRNSIYQLNQAFGADIIIASDQQYILINPELSIVCDVTDFLRDPMANLSLYTDQLLLNFSLKKCPAFETWLDQTRHLLERTYVKACQEKLQKEKHSLSYKETRQYLERLIALDEFEENNYLLLMQLYLDHGEDKKAISTYNQLVNLLDKELGVQPNKNLQNLYQSIIQQSIQQKRIQALPKLPYFFGRSEEIKQVEHFLENAFDGETNALFLQGEDGSGKRSLIRQVLKNHSTALRLISIECHSATFQEKTGIWKQIKGYLDLATRGLDVTFSTPNRWQASHYADHSSPQEPLLFFIEGAQWIDPKSLHLLRQHLAILGELPLAFIFSYSLYHHKEINNFKDFLLLKQLGTYLYLPPFSAKESMEYLVGRLGTEKDLQEMGPLILTYSQGNAFLLSQYADLLEKNQAFDPLPPLVRAQLASQVQDFPGTAEGLLRYLACAPSGLNLDVIAQLTELTQEELLPLLDDLTSSGFIRQEETKESIHLVFNQELLRLFLYDQLSPARIRLLHEQLAAYFETQFDPKHPNLAMLADIIFHYQKANQPLKVIEHQLIELKTLLRAFYDLFPIDNPALLILSPAEQKEVVHLSNLFKTIKSQLKELERTYSKSDRFTELLLYFQYLEGRYSIRSGNYQQGVRKIQEVIISAKASGKQDYIRKGYQQLIHYCVQIDNRTDMALYTELGLEAAIESNNHESIGIFLRLRGLYHLMVGDQEQALRRLHESIDCFCLTPSMQARYPIQIATALDYLAEIAQITGDYQAAINYQRDLLDLVSDFHDTPYTISFQIGLGISFYLSGEIDQAYDLLKKAKQKISSVSFPWKEVQLELYLALLACQKKEYHLILDFLAKKDELLARYSNPRDEGMVAFALAQLSAVASAEQLPEEMLNQFLLKPFDHYYQIAHKRLNPYRDSILLQQLEILKAQLEA